jgi:acyl-CoA synthetase (AMP-forming)/AMP-acid ligase II
LATVGPDERDRLPAVLENLRAHRRVDLVVAILGRVSPDTLHALAALAGIGVVVVLTRPAAVPAAASVLVVDASAAPFATAWNLALTRASVSRASTTRWLGAPAS